MTETSGSEERWRQVRVLVESAMALPLADRAAYLKNAAPDESVYREAVELLGFDDAAADLFSVTAWRSDAEAGPSRVDTGTLVGHYRVLRELGRGGMGAVYLAERADGEYQQHVAVKVLQDHVFDGEMARRFRRERQILATLVHPGIARLLDGGVTAEGRPYLAMEFVEGRPIDRYCDEEGLDVRGRLRLFLKIAEALQAAHQRLVLHLDIKPANILVDAEEQPRLLDFGIARLLDDGDGSKQVDPSLLLMTPRYASPEQVAGETLGISSDIFSLTTLLYRLLTGTLPYPMDGVTPLEAARILREVPPQLPSSIAPPAVATELHGDLDTILLQGLRKEPERRYPTVEALAEDVRRYLDGRPVLAHADSVQYRVSKFVRRHRIGVVLGVTAAVLLTLTTSLAVRSATRAARSQKVAERRLKDVQGIAHSYVFDLEPKLALLPGTIGVRHFVLLNAQKYLEAMSKEMAGDDNLAREVAEGYVEIGRVQATPGLPSLSDWNAAAISKSKGVAIEERLLSKHSENLEDRGLLVRQLINLSQTYEFLDDLKRREQVSLHAWEVAQPLLAAGPNTKRYVAMSVAPWMLARIHGGVGDDWSMADPVGAEPWLRETENILNAYSASHPNDQRNATLLAMRQRVVGTRTLLLKREGRNAEARQLYEAELKKTSGSGNGQVEDEARRGLLFSYAEFLLDVGDVRGAEAAIRSPRAALVHEVGSDRQLTFDQADELLMLARVDLRLHNKAVARNQIQSNLTVMEKLHSDAPDDAVLHAQLAFSTLRVGEEANLDLPTRQRAYIRAEELANQFAAKESTALATAVLAGKCELGLGRMARAAGNASEASMHGRAAQMYFTKVLAAYPVQPEVSGLLVKARAL